jgi:hypothetical protein
MPCICHQFVTFTTLLRVPVFTGFGYMHSHYYTAKQVADLAGCSKIWVQKNLELGKLKSFRQGKYGRGRGRHIILANDAEIFISEIRMRRTLRAADAYHKSQEVS